jgi:hypothetical protein
VFILTGIRTESESSDLYDELEKAIKEAGGTIMEDFNWKNPFAALKTTKTLGNPSVILLADKPHRTTKYFFCLASGIPCLHYNWIKHCVDKV